MFSCNFKHLHFKNGTVNFYRGQPKVGTGRKMLCVRLLFFLTSCFQGSAFRCYSNLTCQVYRWISWFWEKHEALQDKDYNFLGNDKFSNLYERLLHMRKLKSGYLKRRIYERPLKSEPFIENEREQPSRISLRSLSLKNKSSTLKKFIFKRILSILLPKSSKLHRHVKKSRKLYNAHYVIINTIQRYFIVTLYRVTIKLTCT